MHKRASLTSGVIGWLAVLAAAMLVDRAVAEWVKARAVDTVPSHWHVLFDKRDFLMTALRLPGYFYFTLAVAAVAWFVYRPRGAAAAALLLISGALGGALYSVIKWLVGRHRPINGIDPFHFTPFPGGWTGLFVSPPNLSFPSGHATLAFATAASLAILAPKWRWLFFLGACLVGAERVLENAHYVSDAVAGAGLGVISACLAQAMLKRKTGSEDSRGFDVIIASEKSSG